MQQTSTSTTVPDSTESPSPAYRQYQEAVQRLKAIEALHDFTPEGEARYQQAARDAQRAFARALAAE